MAIHGLDPLWGHIFDSLQTSLWGRFRSFWAHLEQSGGYQSLILSSCRTFFNRLLSLKTCVVSLLSWSAPWHVHPGLSAFFRPSRYTSSDIFCGRALCECDRFLFRGFMRVRRVSVAYHHISATCFFGVVLCHCKETGFSLASFQYWCVKWRCKCCWNIYETISETDFKKLQSFIVLTREEIWWTILSRKKSFYFCACFTHPWNICRRHPV